MAKFKGEDARVYLGNRDFSGDAISIEPKFSRMMHDVTVLNSTAKVFSQGEAESSMSFEAFYDTASGIVAQVWDDIFLASGRSTCSIFLGNPVAIGSKGMLFPSGYLKQVGQPEKVNAMVMLNGEIQPSGQACLCANVLHALGAESATGNSATYDNLVAQTNGGMANLHVTSVTGSNPHTIKVQHSTDGSSWVDLITFTSVAGATSEPKTVSGTVNRYRRVIFTVGATSSVTFIVGFGGF